MGHQSLSQPDGDAMIAHRELAAGRWWQLSLCEQMGNIGSDVGRAVKWTGKNPAVAEAALFRALGTVRADAGGSTASAASRPTAGDRPIQGGRRRLPRGAERLRKRRGVLAALLRRVRRRVATSWLTEPLAAEQCRRRLRAPASSGTRPGADRRRAAASECRGRGSRPTQAPARNGHASPCRSDPASSAVRAD